jgi:hypothetical protein
MSFNADDLVDSVIKDDLVVADDSVGIANLVVADAASATMIAKPNIRAAGQTVFNKRKAIEVLLEMGPS